MSTPDPRATLAKALKALESVQPDSITEGTTADLGQRLNLLYSIQAATRILVDEVTDSLGNRMEEDTMTIAGIGQVVRKPRFSNSWMHDDSREQMLDDAVRAIIAKLAVDKMTGEVHPAISNAVRETFNLVEACFSIGADPKVGFRKQLGLQTDIYRAKRQTGFSLSIEQVAS